LAVDFRPKEEVRLTLPIDTLRPAPVVGGFFPGASSPVTIRLSVAVEARGRVLTRGMIARLASRPKSG
jgi:hypothetical protein